VKKVAGLAALLLIFFFYFPRDENSPYSVCTTTETLSEEFIVEIPFGKDRVAMDVSSVSSPGAIKVVRLSRTNSSILLEGAVQHQEFKMYADLGVIDLYPFGELKTIFSEEFESGKEDLVLFSKLVVGGNTVGWKISWPVGDDVVKSRFMMSAYGDPEWHDVEEVYGSGRAVYGGGVFAYCSVSPEENNELVIYYDGKSRRWKTTNGVPSAEDLGVVMLYDRWPREAYLDNLQSKKNKDPARVLSCWEYSEVPVDDLKSRTKACMEKR